MTHRRLYTAPVAGRWRVACSCGWSAKNHHSYDEALSAFLTHAEHDHLTEVEQETDG